MSKLQSLFVAPVGNAEIAKAFGCHKDDKLDDYNDFNWSDTTGDAGNCSSYGYHDGSCHIDDDLQSLHTFLAFNVKHLLSPTKVPCAANVSSQPGDGDMNSVVQSCHHHGDHIELVDGADKSQWEKPPYHYSELIELALRDNGMLTVREIYRWISDTFPYYRRFAEHRWQDESYWTRGRFHETVTTSQPAIRHTLTTNSSFAKAGKAQRGYMWAFVPENRRRRGPTGGRDNHWKKRKISEYARTFTQTDDDVTSDEYPYANHMYVHEGHGGCADCVLNPEVQYMDGPETVVEYEDVIDDDYAMSVKYLMPSQAYLNHVPQDMAVAESGLMDNCGPAHESSNLQIVLSNASTHENLHGDELLIDNVDDFIRLHSSSSHVMPN